MVKITDKLNIIKNAKDSIKSSIEAKGVSVGDVSIEEYSSKIDEIQGASFKITNASYLFYGNARIDIVQEMLSLCGAITDVNSMFYDASNLKELDLSKLDISNVINFNNMFRGCSGLTVLDFSKTNVSNSTTSWQSTFGNCKGLITLDLSNFDFSKVKYLNDILYNCTSLENLRSFKNLGKGFTQKSNNYVVYKLDLSRSTNLTHESLIDLITNGLYDLNLSYNVAGGGTLYTQSLAIGSTNIAKLEATEEGQQALAEAALKGWNVS